MALGHETIVLEGAVEVFVDVDELVAARGIETLAVYP